MIESTWLVVPCPRSRAHELERLLGSLDWPRRRTVVVTTTRDQLRSGDVDQVIPVTVSWTGMHISRWWNVGLNEVERLRTTDHWHVFCPGSDVVGRPDSIGLLVNEMHHLNVSMIGPSWFGHATADQPVVWRDHTVRSVTERVPGACFMLRGEDGLRCDETFRWWYTDDDLEMQARSAGGAAVVADTGLVHEYDHELDAEQAQHAVEDRERFRLKWNREPW